MSADPSDDDQLARGQSPAKEKKPPAVWFAQVLCAFGSAGAIYFALRVPDATGKIAMGLLGVLYLALLWGTEKRKSWSRWFLAIFLALGAVTSLIQARLDPSGSRNPALGGVEIKPEERSGVAAGQAATIVLILLLAGRLAFGAPSKRYFSSAPRRP